MTNHVVFAVDVGNSHTVIGIFRGDKVIDHWRLTTRPNTTSDEVLNRVGGLLRFSEIKPNQVTHIGLSTVVPSQERPWIKALTFFFDKPVQVVSSENCLNLPISYLNPAMAGSDRLSNIIALRDRGYTDAIIIDMGTATTFDVMKNSGFAGGLIIPGISASLDVLTEKAARLLPVTIEWPDRLIANNTDDAIRSGLLFGFKAELETLVSMIKKEFGKENIPVFATGGWGKTIARRTSCIDTYDPYLTLNGIRLVAVHGEKTVEVDEEGDDE